MTKVRSTLEDTIKLILNSVGEDASLAAESMKTLLDQLEPDIETQIARLSLQPEEAQTALKYLYATVSAAAGNEALGLIYKERQQVVAAIIAVVHTIIATAIV